MQKVHINRNGSDLGQFSTEEVQQGLQTGQFLPTDLAWYSGMAEWKLLRDLPEFYTTPSDTDAPSAPPFSSEVSTIAQRQQGFPMKKEGPAWEQRERLGMTTALIDTVKESLFNPTALFQRMKTTGGFSNPISYYFIVGIVGTFFGLFYQTVFTLLTENASQSVGQLILGSVFALILLPILILFAAFVYPVILKFCLWLLGEKDISYETVLRITSYSGGAMLLNVVPICGGFVASIWTTALVVIGLNRVLGVGTGKGILAVFLPILLCCGLLLIGIVLGGAGAALPGILESVKKAF